MVNSPPWYAARMHLVCMQQLFEMREAMQEPIDCLHPEEERINTATMGNPGAFYCKLCKRQL